MEIYPIIWQEMKIPFGILAEDMSVSVFNYSFQQKIFSYSQ